MARLVLPGEAAAAPWLEHYASQFDTVEVNSTFYGLPKEATVNAWIEQTPDDFRFSVKASRYITHVKRLKSPEKYVERFLAAIEPLRAADRIDAVLWQLPPLVQARRRAPRRRPPGIPERAPGRHVVELRNASWFTGDVYSLLNERGVALAIVDDPALPFVERSLEDPVGIRAPTPREPRARTRRRRSRRGGAGSPPGAPAPTSSPTSTTPRPRPPRTQRP